MRPQFQTTIPKCATEEQVVGWLLAADQVKKNPECGFCTDCHPEFQSRMIAHGRCENPGVEFVVSNGVVVGGVLE